MSSPQFFDGAQIIVLALLTNCISEALLWHTTYKTTKYKGMKLELEKGTKKLEKMKKEMETKNDPKLSKRIEQEESRLKFSQKDLTQCKSKSMMVVSFLTIFCMYFLRKFFAGKIVAVLPFEPIWMIKSLAHSGLEGESEITQCGFIFIYVLSNVSLKASISKFCGFTTTRAVDALATAQIQKNYDLDGKKGK